MRLGGKVVQHWQVGQALVQQLWQQQSAAAQVQRERQGLALRPLINMKSLLSQQKSTGNRQLGSRS